MPPCCVRHSSDKAVMARAVMCHATVIWPGYSESAEAKQRRHQTPGERQSSAAWMTASVCALGPSAAEVALNEGLPPPGQQMMRSAALDTACLPWVPGVTNRCAKRTVYVLRSVCQSAGRIRCLQRLFLPCCRGLTIAEWAARTGLQRHRSKPMRVPCTQGAAKATLPSV